eukprot:TRINITY_DN2547_c0_g1_i1.p1 TRINITY_DN2547_c0_g1~~TRINITY_DN2547_c0_g1_i1.p1  ORF type:complete len:500 (-),score=75.23 TRINITY_DN2547_c0_g1_i1:13-1512(-)
MKLFSSGNLTLKPLQTIPVPVSEPIIEEGEIETDSEAFENSGRTLLKGGSGSSSSSAPVRARYGLSSRFPRNDHIHTWYGLFGMAAVSMNTRVQVYHIGPPLIDAIDCDKESGCNHALHSTFSRDELNFTSFVHNPVENQDNYTLVVNHVILTQQKSEVTNLLQGQGVLDSVLNWAGVGVDPNIIKEPEVYITFWSEEDYPTRYNVFITFMGLSILAFIIQLLVWNECIYVPYYQPDKHRKYERMPFPDGRDIGSREVERTFANGDARNTDPLTVSKECKTFTSVDASNNDIAYISHTFNKLNSLQRLNLCSNKLKSINYFTEVHSLRWLKLDNNDITDISEIKSVKSLEWLSLLNNDLRVVSFEKLNAPKLKFLNLASNDIEVLDMKAKDITSLKWLDASFNNIKSIKNFFNLKKLTHLDLSSNYLEDTEGIEECESLEYLNLANNRLSDPDPIISLSYQIDGLKILDISHNRFTPADIRKIHNHFESLDKSSFLIVQ